MHIIKRNRPAAVVLSEDEYECLAYGKVAKSPDMRAMHWLLSQPAGGKRSKARIDANSTPLVIAFFDASALIHLIEGREPFAGKIHKELAAIADKHPDLGAAISRLSWLECKF